MSCISLRLPPARKAWKTLTSTLTKLHKTRTSSSSNKSIKNLRKLPNTAATKPASRTPKLLVTRRLRRKKLATAVRTAIFSFHKKPAPVYIDRLFKEPSCELVEHTKPKPRAAAARKEDEAEAAAAGTSEGGGSERACTSSDDMWESVALGSAQMQGIDERAEEFIARFRGQMAAQERSSPEACSPN